MGITVIAVIIGSIVIAAIMETIKYKAYDNEAEKRKMRNIGWLLSIAVTPILYFGFELVGKPITMILYAVIIFLLQKEVDMELIRPKIKEIIERKIDRV